MKKRILIFSLAYYPHTGGAEIAMKEITDRINDSEFHLITMNFGSEKREERVGNVVVHRVGRGASYLQKIFFVPRAALCAARLHREYHVDAFWAVMSYMLFPVVLARIVGVRVPYLLTLQDGDPFEHVFSRWFILPFRPLLNYGFRHAAAVQTISTFLAGWARRMGYHGDTAVVPNGINLTRFSSNHAEMTSKDVILTTTSRLVHKNAVDDVIRALVLLPPCIQFVIYGSGPDEAALKALAEQLGVAGRVQFKGNIPYEEIPHALASADIFIRPSRSEGMGNSFIEAFAAGVPVIATQEGGIADFLFDARRNPDKPTTGWSVDKDSPEQIAHAVQDIIAHPTEVVRVCANARRLVEEHYDWNRIADEMHELFDRVSANR